MASHRALKKQINEAWADAMAKMGSGSIYTGSIHKPRVGRRLFIAILLLGLVALTNTSWGDDKQAQDAKALAKASQNPISSLISLPFENNATFNNGSEDAFVDVLNIKPVIPVGITENWNLQFTWTFLFPK